MEADSPTEGFQHYSSIQIFQFRIWFQDQSRLIQFVIRPSDSWVSYTFLGRILIQANMALKRCSLFECEFQALITPFKTLFCRRKFKGPKKVFVCLFFILTFVYSLRYIMQRRKKNKSEGKHMAMNLKNVKSTQMSERG